jgi:hypothetical protein
MHTPDFPFKHIPTYSSCTYISETAGFPGFISFATESSNLSDSLDDQRFAMFTDNTAQFLQRIQNSGCSFCNERKKRA